MPKSALDDAKQEKITRIVDDLRKRMLELDKLGQRIKSERIHISPQQTKQLLEEIKIPPLKMLK